MADFSVDGFKIGMDLRTSAATAPANSARNLINTYVTPGQSIKLRPGSSIIQILEPGTTGLIESFGKLRTFYSSGTITHSNPLFFAHQLLHPTKTQELRRIHFADEFGNKIYVVAEFIDGSVHHYLVNPAATTPVNSIQDAPNSKIVTIIASKVFSAVGDEILFSGTGNAEDWASANDSGFLPAGKQAIGSRIVTALDQYRGSLVAFTEDSAQIWVVDPDPAQMAFQENINGAGTIYPDSVLSISNDLLALGATGYISLSLMGLTDNVADADIGSPISKLVQSKIGDTSNPISVHYQGADMSQFWCQIGNEVDVLSKSQGSDVSAWSRYQLPFVIDYHARSKNTHYFRSADYVYSVDSSLSDDSGVPFDFIAQFPYANFGSYGRNKLIRHVDAVTHGVSQISFRYNEADIKDDYLDTGDTSKTFQISGNTSPGRRLPVGLMATSVAARLEGKSNPNWELFGFNYNYEFLGAR